MITPTLNISLRNKRLGFAFNCPIVIDQPNGAPSWTFRRNIELVDGIQRRSKLGLIENTVNATGRAAILTDGANKRFTSAIRAETRVNGRRVETRQLRRFLSGCRPQCKRHRVEGDPGHHRLTVDNKLEVEIRLLEPIWIEAGAAPQCDEELTIHDHHVVVVFQPHGRFVRARRRQLIEADSDGNGSVHQSDIVAQHPKPPKGLRNLCVGG